MKYLFVGGYADGEWRHVEPGYRQWCLAEPPEASCVTYTEPVTADSCKMKVHHYDRATFNFKEGELTVYAQAGLTGHEVMARLMHCYEPKSCG